MRKKLVEEAERKESKRVKRLRIKNQMSTLMVKINSKEILIEMIQELMKKILMLELSLNVYKVNIDQISNSHSKVFAVLSLG